MWAKLSMLTLFHNSEGSGLTEKEEGGGGDIIRSGTW